MHVCVCVSLSLSSWYLSMCVTHPRILTAGVRAADKRPDTFGNTTTEISVNFLYIARCFAPPPCFIKLGGAGGVISKFFLLYNCFLPMCTHPDLFLFHIKV